MTWKFSAWLLAMTLIACPLAARAASGSEQLSTKTQGREQALKALDAPDPMERAGVLQEILASKDGVLIDFALRKVMVGTDQELKAMVVRNALENPHRLFNFEMRSCAFFGSADQQAINSNCQIVTNRLSGNIGLIFDQIDPSSGEFVLHSPKSGNTNGRLIATTGKSIGQKIEFALNLGGANWTTMDSCIGRLGLNADGEMAGRITCGEFAFEGGFSIL